MFSKELLSAVSGIVFFLGFVPYSVAILRGQSVPSKATWIIWATMDAVIFATMIAQHSLNGQMVGCVIGASVVLTLALIKGSKVWTKTEKFCLAGSAVSLAIWLLSGNALVAMLSILLVGVIGAIPSYTHAWSHPQEEDKLGWILWFSSCVLEVISIKHWDFAHASQPLTFLLIDGIMVYILLTRRQPS